MFCKNKYIAMCVILFLISCKELKAQYLHIPYKLTDKKTKNTDLQFNGNLLKTRFLENKNQCLKSYLLVTYTEKDSAQVDANDIKSYGVLAFKIAIFQPDINLTKKSLIYTEKYELKNNISYLANNNLPPLPPKSWSATLRDGKGEYLWRGGKRDGPSRSSENESLLECGSPANPCQATELDIYAKKYSLYREPLLIIFEVPSLDSYEEFIDFTVSGYVDQGAKIDIERNLEGSVQAINFSYLFTPNSDMKMGNFKEAEIFWSSSLEHGFPLKYEQINYYNNNTQTILSHRWAYERFNSEVYFPSAWDALVTSEFSSGLYAKHEKGITLYVEFDEPNHQDHPALAPDSLADWLGICLRWENVQGCQVESRPRNASGEWAAPRCRSFAEIREKLASDEIKLSWPFAEETQSAP